MFVFALSILLNATIKGTKPEKKIIGIKNSSLIVITLSSAIAYRERQHFCASSPPANGNIPR